MNRSDQISRLEDASEAWDLIIVGGGATGLGTAIEAAARGYAVLLVEQSDFARGTSSRSTKLVHGGVRYLQQGNVSLVVEALRERGRLLRNAPHLVHNLPFVVPNYDWWEGPFYGIGLKIYDMLAGKEGFGPSRHLSREETIERIPTIEPAGLRGGTVYYDGQFDDARLAINMAQTAINLGAAVVNYVQVTGLVRQHDQVRGIRVRDLESGVEREILARAVINATGVFSDALRHMDDAALPPLIQPSQGIHIVLDRSFLPGDSAIMVPHTDDGRVLFAIPWYERTVIGTTDTPVDQATLEPRPLEHELAFLLEHAQRYLTKDAEASDVLSCFAGLRPLVRSTEADVTSEISRDHTLQISRSGLVTITGGKWTTYRKMAEDTVDHAAVVAGLEDRPSETRSLRLHGWHEYAEQFGALAPYGADAPSVRSTCRERAGWGEKLHPRLPYFKGEVIWAARHEMARTVEDVLSRRTRALLLDARASIEAAPEAALLLAEALGRDPAWAAEQVRAYRALAEGYLLPPTL
ncbi:MAG: glycerol-3-phosphate dehydrogenase/oxidase [Rhodothermales bacterium]|nr:glycerol-3-phosphate dehydrogenase/oxidase [Rhodothermales bacterium]